MAIAGTNIQLDSMEGMDKITQTEKVTSPYFSDGSTTINGVDDITSSSLSDTNEKYFFGISKTGTETVTEFNVAFGSTNGFGADSAASPKPETEAIYKQFASLLLPPMEVTGGFIISDNGSAGVVTGKDTEIFILSATRNNMKDRINKGTWTIALSGSDSVEAGSGLYHYTDDSVSSNPTATPMGDRYNIVTGSAGVVHNSAASQSIGFFYPDMGIMIFSAAELSASIPGNDTADCGTHIPAVFDTGSQRGFGTITSSAANGNQALRFINCLMNSGSLTFRDEEDQVSAQYFCRIKSGHMNFSNNPTFVSGSMNELRNEKMKDNPQTFITQVQLYNNNQDLVAVGNLSTPLKKNFSSEATIKVKLTY